MFRIKYSPLKLNKVKILLHSKFEYIIKMNKNQLIDLLINNKYKKIIKKCL
jgi:hypothetical protein